MAMNREDYRRLGTGVLVVTAIAFAIGLITGFLIN